MARYFPNITLQALNMGILLSRKVGKYVIALTLIRQLLVKMKDILRTLMKKEM